VNREIEKGMRHERSYVPLQSFFYTFDSMRVSRYVTNENDTTGEVARVCAFRKVGSRL
jgi:hypothetical protein